MIALLALLVLIVFALLCVFADYARRTQQANAATVVLLTDMATTWRAIASCAERSNEQMAASCAQPTHPPPVMVYVPDERGLKH